MDKLNPVFPSPLQLFNAGQKMLDMTGYHSEIPWANLLYIELGSDVDTNTTSIYITATKDECLSRKKRNEPT